MPAIEIPYHVRLQDPPVVSPEYGDEDAPARVAMSFVEYMAHVAQTFRDTGILADRYFADLIAARTAAAGRFGYGLHYSSHITYTKLDEAWHAGWVAAIESEFADVHPPRNFSQAEREQFYLGRAEGYRELEHQQEQARLATCGDVVAISNRYDRDEARGGWGHAANEFEAMAEAV